MRAAVFHKVGEPMTIEDVTIAEPGPHEVLLRTMAVGICHSDLHVVDGHLPHPLPVVLGHEAAGIVEQVGSHVTTVKPGDHVIGCLVFYCGHCDQCLSGHPNRCFPADAARSADLPPRLSIGGEKVGQFCNTGSFAELMLVHESGCVPVSKEIPFDRACLVSCGVTTGFGAATRTAGVRPGETVAVIGCGGVGLAAVNGAAAAGARQIIAIDRLPLKLEYAKTFGATEVIDASAENVVDKVMQLTGGRGVDHAIECIGLAKTAEQAFTILGRGGTATIAGVIPPGVNLQIPGMSLLQEKRIQGSMMGGVRPSIDIPRYVELYLLGKLKLDELISQRITLDQINKGFADLANGQVARSVIMMNG